MRRGTDQRAKKTAALCLLEIHIETDILNKNCRILVNDNRNGPAFSGRSVFVKNAYFNNGVKV